MEQSKKRPVIAVDVDEVLRDNLGIMVNLYKNVYYSKYKEWPEFTVDDITEFKVDVRFPLIKEYLGIKASDYFFHIFAKEMFLDAPAYPGVAENIKKLKEVADVIIITYQKDFKNKKYTLEWLEDNGIEPNGICFLRDKTLVHCDALIDDNDWNFLGTHNGTSVLVTQPYNKDLNLDELLAKTNSKQIVRVDSFNDFVEKYLKGEIVI